MENEYLFDFVMKIDYPDQREFFSSKIAEKQAIEFISRAGLELISILLAKIDTKFSRHFAVSCKGSPEMLNFLKLSVEIYEPSR